jgi:transcriptional regulator NrdR family protein
MCEPLPCADCGAEAVRLVIESCRLADGVQMPRLQHYRCHACGTRFFTDEAMDEIRSFRVQGKGHPVLSSRRSARNVREEASVKGVVIYTQKPIRTG